MIKKSVLAAIGLICLVPSVEANAAVVNYTFAGVWDTYTIDGPLFPLQTLGFSGTFTYDDTAPDTNPAAGISNYSSTGAITSSVGGSTFANTPVPYDRSITSGGSPSYVFNSYWNLSSFNCSAFVCATSGDSGGSFDGNPIAYLYNYINLQSIADAGADSGGAINPPALSVFLSSIFHLQAGFGYHPETGHFDSFIVANGHLTSLSAVLDGPSEVPLPAALPLFVAGLSAMGFMGWRRKQRAA
jgi:hypothetical protein